MEEIRLIEKNTDLSNLRPLDWDVIINNKPYFVVRIKGYVHTIGGRWGANNYWAYPRDEIPSYENLIEFNPEEAIMWGIKYDPKIQTKHKWGETEARKVGGVIITRNGENFYTVGGGLNYGIDKARIIIEEFNEHPINVHSIDFDKKIIGRKVWWRSEPGVITSWIKGQASVIIEPDGIPYFSTPKEFCSEDYFWDDNTSIKADILDKHIWWFRD